MTSVETVPVKYVFLDIVQYTQNRSVEAQSDIICILNEIVRTCVDQYEISDNKIIYLPTGDGICIAIQLVEKPYDLHLLLALKILGKLESHNKDADDDMRKFKIRIGIETNVDNLVIDINGNRNLAGAGINMAQRIMNIGDGNQIMVGRTVYETLRQREKYLNAFRYLRAKVKHGLILDTYQFIKKDCPGLSNELPIRFRKSEKKDEKLPKLIAYYFAQAIRNRKDLIKLNKGGGEYSCEVLLWYLAKDSLGFSETTELTRYSPQTAKGGQASFAELFEEYYSYHFWVTCDLSSFLKDNYLRDYSDCFEGETFTMLIFVNEKGIGKLKKEWPDIWAEFDLDSYV